MSPATALPTDNKTAQKGVTTITIEGMGKTERLNPGSRPEEYVTKITTPDGSVYPVKTPKKVTGFSNGQELSIKPSPNKETYDDLPIVELVP